MVRADRKQTMHVLVEQIMLPDSERLALVIEKANEEKVKRSRLNEEERIFLEQ